MNRRKFLYTSMALAGLPVLSSFGQQLLQAQVPLDDVIEAYKSQECPEWCWAASISMIFALYGHPTDQQRVAATLYGTPPPCATGQPNGILTLLNRMWTDDDGNKFTCRTTAMFNTFAGVDNMTPRRVIDSLKGGDPLLLCTTHHAMVLTEVRYFNTLQGPILREMGVADPWPGNGLRSLNNAEGTKTWAGGQLTILAGLRVRDSE